MMMMDRENFPVKKQQQQNDGHKNWPPKPKKKDENQSVSYEERVCGDCLVDDNYNDGHDH